jgi:DNA-directed RNA polymerase subunit RPC12/RpoP
MTVQVFVGRCFVCDATFEIGDVSKPVTCPQCGMLNSRALAIKRQGIWDNGFMQGREQGREDEYGEPSKPPFA